MTRLRKVLCFINAGGGAASSDVCRFRGRQTVFQSHVRVCHTNKMTDHTQGSDWFLSLTGEELQALMFVGSVVVNTVFQSHDRECHTNIMTDQTKGSDLSCHPTGTQMVVSRTAETSLPPLKTVFGRFLQTYSF